MKLRVTLLLSVAVVILLIIAGIYSLSTAPPVLRNLPHDPGQSATGVRPSLIPTRSTSRSPAQSPLRDAIAPLLDPRKVRILSEPEVRAYLDHFGWTGPRVAAAYYLRNFPGGEQDQSVFLERLTSLVDSDPVAALMVALQGSDSTERVRAAQSLQRQQPNNALGHFLEAAALLKSDAPYSDVKALLDTAFEGKIPDLLLKQRYDPIREAYEFHGMSPDTALAQAVYFSGVAFEPVQSIRYVGDNLAKGSSLEPIDQATRQIAFSRMLEFVFDDEGARSLPYNTFPIEATMHMSELTALRKLPADTFYGEGDYTVGERIADLTLQYKSGLELYSLSETSLRQASDEQLQVFFRVWHRDGFRAAVEESVTFEGLGSSQE